MSEAQSGRVFDMTGRNFANPQNVLDNTSLTKGGDGGGTMSESYVDAKIEASRAQFSESIMSVNNEIRQIASSLKEEIDDKAAETRKTVIYTSVGIVFSILGILMTFVYFGGDQYSSGMQAGQAIQSNKNDISSLKHDLGLILDIVRGNQAKP